MTVWREIFQISSSHTKIVFGFGYDWFKEFLHKMEVKVIIVTNEKLSSQEEIVQNLISIIHVCSCRIYGLRKYKEKMSEDEEL